MVTSLQVRYGLHGESLPRLKTRRWETSLTKTPCGSGATSHMMDYRMARGQPEAEHRIPRAKESAEKNTMPY